jgi:tagatose 1,6-diphosphate aldolase
MPKTMTAPAAHKDHFLKLSPGKLTGLRQITDASGKFKVLALDQSNSFKKAIVKLHDLEGVKADPTYEEIRDAKLVMVEYLAPYASATLLDVNFGARQALNSMVLPRGVGLIVRSEASKDAGLPSEYEPGWSVEKIKKMGASAVKLLVYIDHEDKAGTKAQLDFAAKLFDACRSSDILLMTEELSFPRKGEEKASPTYQARKVKNILEATRLIGPLTDILKLEFPGDIKNDSDGQMVDNLGRLNDAAIRPWVLLSAGEKFDLFAKQAELAMKAGCSGYMAGRAIFNEYFDQKEPAARQKFLTTTGVERMKKLNSLVDRFATTWNARFGLTPADLASAVQPDWYLEGAKAAKKPAKMVQGEY